MYSLITMKYESRNYGLMSGNGIIRIALMLVVMNLVVYYYSDAPSEKLIYFTVALLGIFVLTNLFFPGKSVITIENSAVTFMSAGMVIANFDLNDVASVELSTDKCNKMLFVSTKDDLKFAISTSGYSDEEITEIIDALKSRLL